MTDINAEGQATRRPQTFAQLMAVTGSDKQTLLDIIDHFRAEGVSFLTPYGGAPIAPDTLIDISHEALIRCWQKLADDKHGWLQREFEDGLIWKSLRIQARKHETLSAAATDDREKWLRKLPSEDWCKRYQGDWNLVQDLMAASRKARDEHVQLEVSEAKRLEAEARHREAEERARRAEEGQRAAAAIAAKEQEVRAAQARRARLAVAAAVVGAILTMLATGGFFYAIHQKARADIAAKQAHAAVIETRASLVWAQLQLWGDPLRPEDVATLWDLTQQDDNVRVAFVRQLANSRDLLTRFGFQPDPIARAVGLVWPDEARAIIEQIIGYTASKEFDPHILNPLELVSYSRVLASVTQFLDPETLDSGTQKIASAIIDLARAPQLTEQQLWALAEMIGVFADRSEWELIEPARRRLLEIIGMAEPSGSAGWRGQAVSRAIELMAPDLTGEERSRAVQYLAPLLGQNTDSWAAKAAPRALAVLIPELDDDQAAAVATALAPAIARAASAGAGDSSYLLTLMQVAEKVASMNSDEPFVAAFGRALTAQLARPNEPLQRAALARATVPFLARSGRSMALLIRSVAEETLIPEQTVAGPDAPHVSQFRQAALEKAEAALQQALPTPDGVLEQRRPEEALQILHQDWTAEPSPNARANPYRRAAQVRLAAVLVKSLDEDSDWVTATTADLLAMLPRTQDYLTREGIARALAALADKLPDPMRAEALAAAKRGLAWTGSTEEASAWADAIAVLLPADPRAATADIVEALKYPTATGAPSEILLSALAKRWPKAYTAIVGRKLPDRTVLDWLEAHVPDGYNLTDPPARPPGLQSAAAGPAPG